MEHPEEHHDFNYARESDRAMERGLPRVPYKKHPLVGLSGYRANKEPVYNPHHITSKPYKTIACRTGLKHRSDVVVRLYHYSSSKSGLDVQLCHQCTLKLPVALHRSYLLPRVGKARRLEALGSDLPCGVKEAKSLL